MAISVMTMPLRLGMYVVFQRQWIALLNDGKTDQHRQLFDGGLIIKLLLNFINVIPQVEISSWNMNLMLD